MHSGEGSLFSKDLELEEMSNLTPDKNGLIPAVVQTVSVWFVNRGCNFIRLLSSVSPHMFCHVAVMYPS